MVDGGQNGCIYMYDIYALVWSGYGVWDFGKIIIEVCTWRRHEFNTGEKEHVMPCTFTCRLVNSIHLYSFLIMYVRR